MPIVLTSGPWCSDRGAVFGLQVVGWVGMSGYGGGGMRASGGTFVLRILDSM